MKSEKIDLINHFPFSNYIEQGLEFKLMGCRPSTVNDYPQIKN